MEKENDPDGTGINCQRGKENRKHQIQLGNGNEITKGKYKFSLL